MTHLRIGLLGTSGRANLAEQWQEDGRARVVAGYDIDDEYLAAFQERYGADAFVTKDYHELLARADIDAVGVFTPDWLHAEMAIAALEAGKHVYLEKPMAITVEDCDAVLRAHKKSGKKLFMGFNMRYMNFTNVMRDVVQSGTIGEIKAAWVRHFVGFGGYAYFHDWHATRKNGTSLLLQKATHDIDIVHYVTGQYTSMVSGIGGLDYHGGDMPDDLTCPECDLRFTCPDFSDHPRKGKQMCAYRKEIDMEDNQIVLMQLAGGVRATYMQCHFTPDTWRNYTFIGTKGRVENIDSKDTVRLLTRKDCATRHDHEFNYAEAIYHMGAVEGGHGGSDPSIAIGFLDYVLKDVPPRATPLDGRMSVAVGCLGAESIRGASQPIKIVEPRL